MPERRRLGSDRRVHLRTVICVRSAVCFISGMRGGVCTAAAFTSLRAIFTQTRERRRVKITYACKDKFKQQSAKQQKRETGKRAHQTDLARCL